MTSIDKILEAIDKGLEEAEILGQQTLPLDDKQTKESDNENEQ